MHAYSHRLQRNLRLENFTCKLPAFRAPARWLNTAIQSQSVTFTAAVSRVVQPVSSIPAVLYYFQLPPEGGGAASVQYNANP